MGKSKTGGTRGYIRGRIANDVYSIGKDGKGKKQQVIRSLAESVANPRTTAQMRGRMIMSTVMQAVAGLVAIIDHSFDGIAKGQPSISEFIRRNYALVKADEAANPDAGNQFGLNKYGEKVLHAGAYVVSDGKKSMPAGWDTISNYQTVEIDLGESAPTFGNLKEAFATPGVEFLTMVGIKGGKAIYSRLQLNANMADSTALTAQNIASCFVTEGNYTPQIQLLGDATKHVSIDLSDGQGVHPDALGAICSFPVGGGFEHNPATLFLVTQNPQWQSIDALPTYPTGAENYLNGGEI